MDPTALILGALSAGATAALQETATQAIKDGYQALKTLLEKKFKDHQKAKMVLEEHEKDPQTWQKPLKQALKETGVESDPQILKTARQLMTILQQSQTASGKYSIQVEGEVKGMVVGDQAKVTMTFDNESENGKKKKR